MPSNPVRNLADVEDNVRNFWDDIDLLESLEEQNEDGDPYFLLDGPPFANNEPHIGHFRNTVYKDVYIRYAQLRGDNTQFRPGFDTHGLPVENAVQKEHGIRTKEDIEALGEEAFMELCREHATTYMEEFLDSYRLLGSWYGWREPYVTYDNSYIESVWQSFQTIYDKDLAYRGKKPVYWCPVDQTTMAGYEVTDSYEMVEDPMVIVKFQLKDRDASLIAYTTTPWTLPSNAFLCVHPDEAYVEVQTGDDTIILAKERLELLDEISVDYTVQDEFPGSDLTGLEYEPLIDCTVQDRLADDDNAHKVYSSIKLLKERVSSGTAEKKDEEAKDVHEHFVTVDSGTGIVHCAPGHGKSDYEVGLHYDIPLISPLNDACKYTGDVEPYAGMFVKDADEHIVDDLQSQGSLLYTTHITHKYPVSWRSEAPLIFRLSDQWFFDVESVKDDMLAYNEDVEWQPSFAYERFKNWVEGAEDWNFTRQRYWGIPVPLFIHPDDPEDVIVIGSEDELRSRVDQDLDEEFDLHLLDNLTITVDNTTYEPLGDVFDVWFDSGNVPYGSTHYPFENKELFEDHFPVSRINEAQDQIRGWFYSLMYVSAARMEEAPYETVSMPGWVMNRDGEKLSKSKGNFEPVPDLVDEHGADNIRFYYCWDTDPGKEMKFDKDTMENESSEALDTLWHLTQYLKDNVDEVRSLRDLDVEREDEWVLHRAHQVTKTVKHGLDEFEIDNAGQGLYDFIVKDLSRNYVQLVRERTRSDTTPYHVLYHAVHHATKLLAPITPHFSERIHQELSDLAADEDMAESVHLTRIPTETQPFEAYEDEALADQMMTARDVIRAALAARDRVGRSIRWPIDNLHVHASAEVKDAVNRLDSVIKRRVNAESLSFTDRQPPVKAEPRFKEIGSDHGENTQAVASTVRDNAEALRGADDTVRLNGFDIHPRYYELTPIQPGTGAMGSGDGFYVFLDDDQPDHLDQRGLMREVLRRVQTLRKDEDLDKDQLVDLVIDAPHNVQGAIEANKERFVNQAGVNTLTFEATDGETYNVDGDTVTVSLTHVRG
jgi:isoleucyl-tRNA synthetase